MFTKNFNAALARSAFTSSILTSNTAESFTPISGYDMSGKKFISNSSYPTTSLYSMLNSVQTSIDSQGGSTQAGSRTGVVFSDLSTEPSVDDYEVGNYLTTLSAAKSIVGAYDSSGMQVVATYTVTNTGDADFTVNSVCLIAGASTVGSYYYTFLMNRILLDAPVTIPAGGIGVITVTIRYDYPT